MTRQRIVHVLLLFTMLSIGLPFSAWAGMAGAPGGQQGRVPGEYLVREVRHQILLLPYYSIFDNIEYKVSGYTVELLGEVTNPTLKSDAGNVVKHIEGVQKVTNNIKVLPPSPSDNRIRVEEYRAIYGYPALVKYAHQVVGPIHIIVDMGHVTLDGVVDSQTDKNLVNLRANTVPGIFSVTNNLRIVSNQK